MTGSAILAERVIGHLRAIYPGLDPQQHEALADSLRVAVGAPNVAPAEAPALPGADEVVLITYADSIRAPGEPPLRTLLRFVEEHLDDSISTVHVLPFFESSSDGGFAVVDYQKVAAEAGDWPDVVALGAERRLMVDLVCNHGSAQSEWFGQFLRGELPGRDYFKTADPGTDLSAVVRPRTHPLLTAFETASGVRHVWTTFSADQVDFDFGNPAVLAEFCAIIGHYLDQGSTRIRLDAIGFLWKIPGTPCIHLPQTHEVVKLLRTLIQARDPDVLLITETNVAHDDNVAYFGDGDEAHVVYNFTLAPLIVWSVLTESSEAITDWLADLQPPPAGCAFLNFIASHDGLGLRPVENLIEAQDLSMLLEAASDVGGRWSEYESPDGPRPYEVNVSLADLLAGPDGATASRFVCAHAVLLAMQGIPAIYLHSLLTTTGDHAKVVATRHNRDINRTKLSVDAARDRVTLGWPADVFKQLTRLLAVRRLTPGFGPETPQTIHNLGSSVIAVERGVGSGRVLAISNVSSKPTTIVVALDWLGDDARDLIESSPVALGGSGELELDSWQTVWLVAS